MTDTINYNGKRYPIKIGYYALKHSANEMKEQGVTLKLSDILSSDLEKLEPVLFYSLVMGARLEKQELDITREETEFVLDQCFREFVQLIPAAFKREFADNPENETPETTNAGSDLEK